jgi:hypothetical protein
MLKNRTSINDIKLNVKTEHLPMIENRKNAVDNKYCAAVVAGSEMLSQLISVAFSLSFFTNFSHPVSPLKPYGYYTHLIVMQHV